MRTAYKNRFVNRLSAGSLHQWVASHYAGAQTYQDNGSVYHHVQLADPDPLEPDEL